MAFNEKHSFQDYTGGVAERDRRGKPIVLLSDLPAEEFSGTTIVGSCFSCETPDSDIFPVGTDGVAFERCNLMNVSLPPHSTTDDRCQTTRYKAFEAVVKASLQKLKDANGEDAPDQDWEVDGADLPLGPLNAESFAREGWSTDPRDYTLTATQLSVAEVT